MLRSKRKWVTFTWLGIVLCLGLTTVLGLKLAAQRRQHAALIVSRQQIEQRAIQHVQGNYPGAITQVTVRPTTLGLVMGPLNCSLGQRALRIGLRLAALETYNPCDPNAPLWQVEVRGAFTLTTPSGPSTSNNVEVIYDETGGFIRSGWGSVGP